MSIYVKTSTGVSNISESAIQFVKNQHYYQVYDMCHKLIRVVSGNIGAKPTGEDYVLLFTQAELCKMFDTTDVDIGRLSVTTYNGNGENVLMNFYSIMAWKGDLYQYFTGKPNGAITINYRLVYVYPSA